MLAQRQRLRRRRAPPPSARAAQMTGTYRLRRITLRDGREVTLRAIVEADATEIIQAFERLSAQSRYYRFMKHKRQLDDAALQRGVHPRPGRDFVFVATVPVADTIDIVGAAQYVQAREGDNKICEFAITVGEDWRGGELATKVLSSLVRRARSRHDGPELRYGAGRRHGSAYGPRRHARLRFAGRDNCPAG